MMNSANQIKALTAGQAICHLRVVRGYEAPAFAALGVGAHYLSVSLRGGFSPRLLAAIEAIAPIIHRSRNMIFCKISGE